MGEDTRTKITHQEFFGSGVIATITRVCYGTFKDRRACIIAFHFSFHWSRDAHLFKRVEAEISFEPYPRGLKSVMENAKPPVVRNLSRRRIHGIPNTNGRKWFCKVEQQCAVPSVTPDVVSAEPATGRRAFDEAHRVEVVGKQWSDTRRRDFHKACWIVKEIGQPSFGIPDELDVAVLVEHQGGFQAEVKISADVPFYRRLRWFPWPDDDPIIFASQCSGALIGEELRTSQFETLLDADWSSVISGYKVRRQLNFARSLLTKLSA